MAIIIFKSPRAHIFGPPNDEAFSGHPLYKLGLEPYSVSLIKNSSWVKKLEKMNSVHPGHRKKYFEEVKHFIFAFHDSTFECISEGFEIRRFIGSTSETFDEMVRIGVNS